MIHYKNVIYAFAAAMVLIEGLIVELLTESIPALIVVFIIDANLIYLLWKLDKLGGNYDEYDDEE